jgi:hypothetical protein
VAVAEEVALIMLLEARPHLVKVIMAEPELMMVQQITTAVVAVVLERLEKMQVPQQMDLGMVVMDLHLLLLEFL